MLSIGLLILDMNKNKNMKDMKKKITRREILYKKRMKKNRDYIRMIYDWSQSFLSQLFSFLLSYNSHFVNLVNATKIHNTQMIVKVL